MRRLLLALPFALLPLAAVQAEEHHHDHDEHGSLGAHEHGVARLNAALDGKTLELELESPAMNLLGFEHEARSEADKAKVAAARAELEQPLALFAIPTAAGCKVADQELESPLFGIEEEHGGHAKGHEHEHSEINAHYQLQCDSPDALKVLDLAELFKRFPATEKIQVQLIGPQGQQGAELNAANASLSF
ncbi:DUF2796 domain-containing protein [Pseudomonas sp. BN417]|uniref:DUF2796 domain-containing protein n=1 Tax=Pseudomonas sp. BN417 TaxID=2567890 RepID=UPI002455F386|nr:DUF2796 domain-containing protein [Pseudomonas sp. BN417]MDH4558722.1 DUF2796 domain-containing protein [Pseudomonas sp. BN417]